MANVLSSPSDIVNDALRRIGYKLRVGDLYDGSEAAGLALDIYGQTRDTLLRDGDWQFCRRDMAATLLKAAPAGGYFPPNVWDPTLYPPPPWTFEYVWPDDCLKVRQLKSPPLFPLNPDPQPTLYSVVNDTGYTPPRRVIVCNIAGALLTYAGRVTNPLDWPVDFTEALCASLARRLAPSLANLDAEKIEAQDEAASDAQAAQVQG